MPENEKIVITRVMGDGPDYRVDERGLRGVTPHRADAVTIEGRQVSTGADFTVHGDASVEKIHTDEGDVVVDVQT